MGTGSFEMGTPQRYKIVIVGGGPAGLATALFLAQQAPNLAEQTLLIEAQEHPRPKLCGGGVTFHGEEQLERLGLDIQAPAFVVDRLIFRWNTLQFSIHQENAMRIFDRADFDAALADAVVRQGIQMHTSERLLDIQYTADGVMLSTDKGCYHAEAVVAADGAKSTVRRKLRMHNTLGVARLLRTLTPVNPEQDTTWRSKTAVFDFSCVQEDIQGYMWDFPCYVGGEPFINRGIFDSRIWPQPTSEPPRGNLKQAFANGLYDRDINLEDSPLEGHPVRWFNPKADFSQPHVLLAGDAAGVDPLFAEGISYAMEYGAIVAETLQDAFARGDFAFKGYAERLVNQRLGQLLMRRALIARSLYNRRYSPLWSVLWRLAAYSPRRTQRQIGAYMAVLAPHGASQSLPEVVPERVY